MKLQLYWTFISLSALLLFFGLGWYYCFQRKIFAWLDFLWAMSFILVIVLFHSLQTTGLPNSLRIIDIMYLIWSLRLSYHLWQRIKQHGEDKRYSELKKKWKVWYGLKFFFLFEMEAVLTIVLSIPLILTYPDKTTVLQYISLALFIIAIMGESLADRQLKDFKKTNKDSTKVCDIGLWRYSRHPNYFFEWLIWVSFGLYSLSSIEKWPAVIPAIIMYLLLTKVTGIPPAEKSSLESKKDNYLQYQKQTNAFFLWWPKLLIIFLSLNISLNSFAAGDSMKQQEKIKYVFDNLRADKIDILNDFYDQKTEFIDPLGKHSGLNEVKKYYLNLYQNVRSIEFKYHDIVSNGNSHVLIWTMSLSAEGLKGGKTVTVDGSSYIKFNDSNLVVYHRDFFDMGEFIYEHIPVLGWTVEKVKERLRGDK